MPSVCLYFQIHQPFRLRKYTVFDSDPRYFDDAMNAQLVRRIAERCYVPMNRMLLELIRMHGRLPVALSVTGTALEQFESYCTEVVQGLHALAQTRCVEFLGETFYHSLASVQGGEANERGQRRRRAQIPRTSRAPPPHDQAPLRPDPDRLSKHRTDLLQSYRAACRGHGLPGRPRRGLGARAEQPQRRVHLSRRWHRRPARPSSRRAAGSSS